MMMLCSTAPAPLHFLYHVVVGDLTLGKPHLSDFLDTDDTVAEAIQFIADHSPGGGGGGGANFIPVWKKKPPSSSSHNKEIDDDEQQRRFVGILSALDIVAFLAAAATTTSARREDDDDNMMMEKAMSTAVSELLVVVPNKKKKKATLKVVHPATRLIDALEMMKAGVELLLVPSASASASASAATTKRNFPIPYNKAANNCLIKNTNNHPCATTPSLNANHHPSSSTSSSSYMQSNKYCCLCREDVIRFLIGCLGALAPLPLASIAALGAINPNYSFIHASSPAIHIILNNNNRPLDDAVAVVETTPEECHKIIGEISSAKLWKRCDYLSIAWALAHMSSRQFVTGVDDRDHDVPSSSLLMHQNDAVAPKATPAAADHANGGTTKSRRFNGKSIEFASTSSKSTYLDRSAPLRCRPTSSLAAVMAQMLSHRATHVWVTDEKEEDLVVGVVGYGEILNAVTRQ